MSDVFQGVNAAYVDELYEKYRRDPHAVDAATREFFEQWTPPPGPSPGLTSTPSPGEAAGQATPEVLARAVGAFNLAQSIRRYGHLAAQIDPLGSRPMGDPALEPATHGVSHADLQTLPACLVTGPVADGAASMAEIVDRL